MPRKWIWLAHIRLRVWIINHMSGWWRGLDLHLDFLVFPGGPRGSDSSIWRNRSLNNSSSSRASYLTMTRNECNSPRLQLYGQYENPSILGIFPKWLGAPGGPTYRYHGMIKLLRIILLVSTSPSSFLTSLIFFMPWDECKGPRLQPYGQYANPSVLRIFHKIMGDTWGSDSSTIRTPSTMRTDFLELWKIRSWSCRGL